jgi:hypothetical protein
VAEALDDDGMKLLQDRGRRYYRVIDSPHFQDMCDLATYFVLKFWRELANHSEKLPKMADNIVQPDEDKVSGWLRSLHRWTDEPELSAWERFDSPSPPSRPDDRVQAPSPAAVLQDLYEFTTPLYRVLVGHDLPNFIQQLERIATFFEGESDPETGRSALHSLSTFRRLISYFSGVLDWADRYHLRASLLIGGCYDTWKGPDALPSAHMFAKWLTPDLRSSGTVILAAAEALGACAGVVVAPPEPSSTPTVDASATPQRQAGEAEAPEYGPATPSAQETSPANSGDPWAADGTNPPEEFAGTPLVGYEWQIMWALELAGLLDRPGPKALITKLLAKPPYYWGTKSGHECHVYLRKDYFPEKARTALDELTAIKSRGYYHPDWHKLPDGYVKHRACPLKAARKDILAWVLHEARLLKEATPRCLDRRVASKRGYLFGQYGEGGYTIYMRENFTDEQVRGAFDLLQSKLDSVKPIASQEHAEH